MFAAAQDLDVPFAIHPTFEPQWTKGERMGTWEHVKQLRLLASVTASVWISCDPDERTIPALAERFGADRFVWASDFPHADHTPEYVHDLNELVSAFPEHDRAKFLGDNARALFGLPAGRG